MDTLQIIAEPTRREILGMIWDQEMTASEIAARFDITFGAVSQHLAVLRNADLVSVRRDGNRRIYTADKDALRPYKTILTTMWASTLKDLADVIESGSPSD